jgi:NhaP-type Na+/H+ and K+/H+ antiporter
MAAMANTATTLKLVDTVVPAELSGDLGNLTTLKQLGYTLIQVRVSQFSALRGRLLSTLELPTGQRVLCVLRQDEPVYDLGCAFLRAKDTLFILTNDEEQTRRFFMF